MLDRCATTGRASRAEFLPYVFERFRQADGSTTRRTAGSGSGSRSCGNSSSCTAATVRAESEGEGRARRSRWSCRWHRNRRCRPPCRPRGRRPPDERRRQARRGEGARRGRRRRLARKIIACLLAEQGANVLAASTADEALRQLEAGPDVLLSDIAMPDVDGYALLRRIRARPVERGEDAGRRAHRVRAGRGRRASLLGRFPAHVTKPIDPEALTTVVADSGGQSTTSCALTSARVPRGGMGHRSRLPLPRGRAGGS